MLLPARMLGDTRWSDVRIRNLSTRGIMAETAHPPSRGHYVEIRQGPHIMIGVVVWAVGRRFGVSLSAPVDMDALVRGADGPEREERRDPANRPKRHRAVELTTANDFRWLGQAVQRTALIVGGAALAGTLGFTAYRTLSAPLNEVAAHLASPG